VVNDMPGKSPAITTSLSIWGASGVGLPDCRSKRWRPLCFETSITDLSLDVYAVYGVNTPSRGMMAQATFKR
jgi:hypothetical protein